MINLSINKDILSLAIGNFFRIALVIVYSRVMTFFLEYQELSKFYLAFSVYTFFSFIIIGSLGNYINRKTIEWVHQDSLKSALLQLFWSFLLPLTVIASIVVFIYSYIMYQSINYSFILCALVSSLLLFKTSNETIYPIFNILNKNRKYLFYLILFNLLNLLLSTIFVTVFEPKFQYWMTGLISSNLIVGFFAWRSLSRELKVSKKMNVDFSELISFAKNILIGHVLIWFLTDGFRFIAENKIDSYSLGVLLLGLMVATQIFSIIENFLGQILYPKYLSDISNKDYKQRSKAFNKYFNIIFQTILIVALLTSVISNEILIVLVDSSKINESLISVFRIGIWIEFFRIIINSLKNITLSEYRTEKIIAPYLIGSLFFLAGIFLYFNIDLFSISVLLLFSYLIITMLSIITFNRIIKIKLNYFQLIKILLFISPLIGCLLFFKNIITITLCVTLIAIFLYSIVNKNDISHDIN